MTEAASWHWGSCQRAGRVRLAPRARINTCQILLETQLAPALKTTTQKTHRKEMKEELCVPPESSGVVLRYVTACYVRLQSGGNRTDLQTPS